MPTQKQQDYTLLTQCNCFALRRSARITTQLYESYLRPIGIKPTQFTILAILANTGPIPLTTLADMAALERTGLTRNLKVIEKNGWIETYADAKDKRIRLIKMTDSGMQKLNEAIPLWKQAQQIVEDKLSKDKVIDLREDLTLMNQVLQ